GQDPDGQQNGPPFRHQPAEGVLFVQLPSHLIWLSHGGDGPLFCQLLVIPQLPQGLHVVLDVAVQLRPNGLPLLLRHTAQGRKHPVRIIPPVHIMPGPAPDRPGAPHSPRRSRSARRQPPP
ncbi:50S ribosomal protein L18, partial [Dysosmobacter welbionis]